MEVIGPLEVCGAVAGSTATLLEISRKSVYCRYHSQFNDLTDMPPTYMCIGLFILAWPLFSLAADPGMMYQC